ncbi:MAG: hypothetical protein FJ276_34165 [Planctomycetes bacterium]|nr:hypothetical protein [Planctomycetota bacterium]
MKSVLACIGFVWAVALAANAQPVGSTSVRDGWATVTPPEFHGAINNPLKGFRDYKNDGYGLVKRQYINMTRREALRLTMAANLAAVSDPIVESAERADDRVDNLSERLDSPRSGPADDDERVCIIITN